MLVFLILVITKHVFAHTEKMAPNVMSHVRGIVNVAGNVQRDVTDLHAMSLVTRSCARCPGLCGERCMSVCIQCDTEKFMKKSVHPVC